MVTFITILFIETLKAEEDKMKKVKVLVNCSNHPSNRWSAEQKENWDIITDVPFPEVPAYLDTLDRKYQEILADTRHRILKAFDSVTFPPDVEVQKFLMLQGEFSLCYKLFAERYYSFDEIVFVIPTTERVAEEVTKPDGTTEKKTTFKFVRWRIV